MNENKNNLRNREIIERLDVLELQYIDAYERLIYLERRRWWQFWRKKTTYEYRKEARR